MRYLILSLLLVFISFIGYAQTYTFSNTTASTITSTATTTKTIVVSGVPTSGMVLRQVNIQFGNGSGSSSGDMAKILLKLKDPSNNEINLISSTSHTTTVDAARKYFNIKLRDHAALKTINQQSTATSSTNSKGYPFNQGYYKPEGSFSSFNTTTNVNGNWTFSMSGYASMSTRHFVSIELIFGPPFVVTDIRGTNPNQSCSTRQCLQTGDIFWARNIGYPTNQAAAPANTVGSCGWNGQKDNMAWFYFVPSATTAKVSASGFSTVQESSVFKASNCAGYTSVTGGCGPSDLFSGSAHLTKYYNGSYAGGYAWNQEYSLSGLTIGDLYIFVLDGQSGTQSEFYIELLSGGDMGCIPLPVKLSNFEVACQSNFPQLKWTTSTEINNDYFTVERAVGLPNEKDLNFIEIAKVQGSGNSNIEQNYSFVDDSYSSNKSDLNTYYRLKQTDYDGQFEYFYPILANCTVEQNEISIYPNPNEGEFTINGIRKGDVVSVYSQLGVPVLNSKVTEDFLFNVDISSLAKGIYFVKVQSKLSTFTTKVQVN
jgi:hypothetical protein